MASTPIQLIVDRDELFLGDLSELAAAFGSYLGSLDSATSPSGKSSLGFRLTKISYHSPLTIEAAVEPKDEAADNGPAVAALSIRGIDAITANAARPSGFPDEALENLRRLAGYTSNGKAASITIRAPSLHLSAAVTAAVIVNVDRVLGQGDAIGAIEGSLDTISVHGQPYFTLYDGLTGRGVRCYFGERWRSTVISGLGKRMLVHGRLRRDPNGAPREMRDIDAIEELGKRDGSPDALAGVLSGVDARALLREWRA